MCSNRYLIATLELPCIGYGIRYEYGIFDQKIVNGYQVEEPDNWLKLGNPWEIERPEFEMRVKYFGNVVEHKDKNGNIKYFWENTQDVLSIPYDIPIPGYKNNTVNTLRLWSSKTTNEFDFHQFNNGNYVDAVEEKNTVENISKVLYSNDMTDNGKELRLKQQYFFVSASLQDILRRFFKVNSDIDTLPDKIAIQLNDTHPAISVPELMRLLIDEHDVEWNKAWDLTVRSFGFTNHTLLPEALEKWSVAMLENLLPRCMQIIYQINHHFMKEVSQKFPGDTDRLRRMSIIDESGVRYVRMAYLSIIGSHSLNGVAALHSELQKKLFSDFYEVFPERFNNKTNGVTPRRWILKSNPKLSNLISSKIGLKWVTDLYEFKKLEKYINDADFTKEWEDIKLSNKKELAKMIKKRLGVDVNLNSIFDVQVKRLHEYKRQLLNALHIIHLYIQIKENRIKDFTPRTFIFGAKAAPSYFIAKLVIKLINSIADIVNNDPDVGDKIKVAFLPNYRVSSAEKIFPASDLSEQISTAGKEASGTGNMKFSLNGALTIGTLDGANVEIAEEVGNENIYIFGLTVEEVEELKLNGYNPMDYYNNNVNLKKVIDLIGSGHFCQEDPKLFQSIIDNLLHEDRYMLMADFESYCKMQEIVSREYQNKQLWTKKAILNVARMGKFSSDRTIVDYATDIWKIKSIPIVLHEAEKEKVLIK